LTTQSHFQEVVLNAAFQSLAELALDLEKPIRWAEPFNALVGALVIVIFDPQFDALPGIVEALELRPVQELLPDAFPEAFDFAQGHGVMGTGFEMRDPVLLQLGFKAGSAPPGGVLPAVIGEHLLGWFKLADPDPIDLDHGLRGGAAEQIGRRNKPRVIIEKGDEVGIATPEPKGEDVALPHLIGGGPLEETRPGQVARLGRGTGLEQTRPVQMLPDRFGAGLHQEKPAHPLRDAGNPKGRMGLFEFQDLLRHRGGQLGLVEGVHGTLL
jgi:hypothetical protein